MDTITPEYQRVKDAVDAFATDPAYNGNTQNTIAVVLGIAEDEALDLLNTVVGNVCLSYPEDAVMAAACAFSLGVAIAERVGFARGMEALA